MNKSIKESIAASPLTPSESAPINKYQSNPVVKNLTDILVKDKTLEGVELVRIQEDGDVYHMDLRFEIEAPNPQMQYTREEGKHKAYDIKRKLEVELSSKFNIPSFSIAGVRIVPGVKVYCEFEISFIYANKGNIKPTNESIEKEQRVRALVETSLKLKKTIKNQDPLREALTEAKPTEKSLDSILSEWKKLSLLITTHEDNFRKMIESNLTQKKELETKVFDMMDQLELSTRKVDGIVAKVIAGGTKSLGPTPTEKVKILMSKINEATKKVVEAEFAAKTIQNPFAAHKSISFEKPAVQEEGVMDTIKSGYNKFKSIMSGWYSGAKDIIKYANEFDFMQFAPQKDEMYDESDSQFPIRESYDSEPIIDGKEVDKGSIEIENVDRKDYPDFCDAFVAAANFTDGIPLNDQQLEMFMDQYGDIVNELAHESLHENAGVKREAALTFLERMGEISRPEKG